MLRIDRFVAHVTLASTKNRYYSIAWLRPSFFLSLYCSQWKRRSRDSLETDKTSGRFWVFVSGRFCDRTEEREKLRRAEDLPPKTEGLAPLSVDYSDIMIRDVLIRGLDDEEIRLDVLGESRQDMSLEDALSYVEAKESGKRSASRLIGDSSINTAAAMSSYKHYEKLRAQSNPSENKDPPPTCGYCGRTGHRNSR